VKFLSPKDVIKKAYLREKIRTERFEEFRQAFEWLGRSIDTERDEEHNKAFIRDFLKDDMGYSGVNTAGRADMAIYKDGIPEVLIEVKRPTNKTEMLSLERPNVKSLHEALLYFMRETRKDRNLSIRHIVITNGYEWYIFDAYEFNRLASHRDIEKIYRDAELDRTLFTDKTRDIYKYFEDIIRKHDLLSGLKCVRFHLKERQTRTQLIHIYKLLSPTHLLKEEIANDANTLNRNFYYELLHIIGLVEEKDGSKKLIRRKPPAQREEGSMLENTVSRLESEFGIYDEAKLFETALELNITWLNRLLFLKLLEAKLVRMHRGGYEKFLMPHVVHDFDMLNSLFFDVLAVPVDRRSGTLSAKFRSIPYLNSSLFSPSELEQQYLRISNLRDSATLSRHPRSIVTTDGQMPTLSYLLRFLDGYDFGSSSDDETADQGKTLINSAVLGLIFEKLNGYRDGSFYTPSFITMYMTRETLRASVVEKFNAAFGIEASDIDELAAYCEAHFYKKEFRAEANAIVNSITIVDPAVGSGHFLVSALNELLAIKSELHILEEMHGYTIANENDELYIETESGFFEYVRNESGAFPVITQQIQQRIFHEKLAIIENQLFGVDINPNSVKITRLRLWIELLKHSYYDERGELVTMPNIDINIKTGNSLISRYGLHDEIDIPNIRHAIGEYKRIVSDYKDGIYEIDKAQIQQKIEDIKEVFKLSLREKWQQTENYKKELGKYVRAYGMAGLGRDIQLDALEYNFGHHGSLFGDELGAAAKKERKALHVKVAKAYEDIEQIRIGTIYENAFEWRFEFPEALDDEGNFRGFDVVIGNPPYISLSKLKGVDYGRFGYDVFDRTGDILALFFEKSIEIADKRSRVCFIVSNSWLKTRYGEPLKRYFDAHGHARVVNFEDVQIFDEATVESCIVHYRKGEELPHSIATVKELDLATVTPLSLAHTIELSAEGSAATDALMRKIEAAGKPLKEWDVTLFRGVTTGYNEAFVIDSIKRDELIGRDSNSEKLLKPLIRGRDVQKYALGWEDIWLISTFPSLNLDIELYPAIKEYLESFGKKLEQVGEIYFDTRGMEQRTRKKTSNKWFEIQDQVAYWNEFEKPKIIWGEMSDRPKFTFDETNYYMNNTLFMMTGNHLKYILAFLNSKLSKWYFERISTTTGVGTTRWLIYKVELLPIAVAEDEQPFVDLVDRILMLKKAGEETADLEARIDEMVYALYDLTPEEIAVVEGV